MNRQLAYEGGFQGRTNKLVDACYSFWQGGLFPLLDMLLSHSYTYETPFYAAHEGRDTYALNHEQSNISNDDEESDSEDESDEENFDDETSHQIEEVEAIEDGIYEFI